MEQFFHYQCPHCGEQHQSKQNIDGLAPAEYDNEVIDCEKCKKMFVLHYSYKLVCRTLKVEDA